MDKELFIEESGLFFTAAHIPSTVIEATQKSGLMLLKGVPATVLDHENGNGRKYTSKEMKRSIDECRKNKMFEQRRLLSSADDHPEESYVSPTKASHIVTNAYIKKQNEKQVLLNDWLVLNTESGRNLQALVHAGASFGTSIRGLGQLNKQSKEVENYEFLGCDGVGNPSAKTFASKGQFEVTVESVSSTLVPPIKESEDSTMKFNLQEKIAEFKDTHFINGQPPVKITQEVTADLLAIQREAVENSMNLGDLEALSDELFGQSSKSITEKAPPPSKDENVQRDINNRAARELEATQNLATHLQSQIKELEGIREDMKKEIAAYEKVAEGYEKVAVTLYEQLEVESINGEKTKEFESKTFMRKAVSTIRSLQKEAHEVIKTIEGRLDTAIRIGDSAMDTAVTLRRIADSLYSRQIKVLDEDKKAFRHSRTTVAKVEQTHPGLTEDQKKNKSSFSGNRNGWV
jgi:hypothetical protein